MFYKNKPEYKALLPPVFHRVEEITALDSAITTQLALQNSGINNNVDDKSVANATEQGVARWEKILGVNSPINSTLQARKDALKSKLIAKPPINLNTLRAVVEAYLGVTVEIETWWSKGQTVRVKTPYVINIYYQGTKGIQDVTPLYATIYELIPANIVVNICYRYDTWSQAQAKNATWGDFKQKTWDNIISD